MRAQILAREKTNNMKSAYLIYYHDQDPYEGQDVPFAIVKSKKRAEAICQNIIRYGQALAEQMLYPFEEGISDEEYFARGSKNGELAKAPWPHDWEGRSYSDFEKDWSQEDGPQKMKFDSRTVAYRELPLL